MQSLEPRFALAVGVGGDFAGATGHSVDTAPPEIRSVKAPKAVGYAAGDEIAFRVTFTEPVIATGVPTLPIAIGDTMREAAWNGRGNGTKSLTFRLGVQSGDVAPTGVRVAGPIILSDGAAIRDRAGNDLIRTASGEFPSARVDALAPTVMSMGQVAINGKSVSTQVTFTEPVTVRGKPTIPFTLDGAPRILVYARGSGSNVLVFKYRATQRETPTPDNVSVGARIKNGRIVDRARNAASLAQPTDISLSAASLPENEPAGTVVGVLSAADADGARDRHTFTLVDGPGSTDNASFSIVGNELRAMASFDFESENTSAYSVRVRSTDQGGLFTEKTFTITLTDLVVEMALSVVGDEGNQADSTGYGAVDYQYLIGTYEVTIGQYTAFLNAVAQSDPYSLYNTSMALNLNVAGISRTGSPGSYTYSVIAPAGVTPAGAERPADRPITYVSWFDAARFANWMHNGQGSGSTETGAYTISTGVITAASRTNNVITYTLAAPSTLSVGDQVRVTGLSGLGFNTTRIVTSVSGSQFTMAQNAPDATATGTGAMTGASPTASVDAIYRLPTENEWYKAAYYSPLLNAGAGGYYAYATQSDTAPGNTIGDEENQANYYAGDYTVTQSSIFFLNQNYLTNVGAFTNSASYYGTFDQSGNAREWGDEIVSGSSRGLRGGYWLGDAFGLSSSARRLTNDPSNELSYGGFRLASPPKS